jgi:hypothetical protein
MMGDARRASGPLLRFARDRAEFDQSLAEQRHRPFEPDSQAEPHVKPCD